MPTQPPQGAPEDVALCAAALRREGWAVDELGKRLACVPRFLDRLNARMGRRLSRHDIEDLVGEVCVTVLANVQRFHGRVPIEAWVHRICLFTLQNRLRGVRHTARTVDLGDDLPDPATATERAERAEDLVVAALDALGGAESQIIRMHFFDGMPFDAIAKALATPLATVRTRFYRGMERIRKRTDLRTGDNPAQRDRSAEQP
jgi:RNA polymerase sigma factor (sigma-70 family)